MWSEDRRRLGREMLERGKVDRNKRGFCYVISLFQYTINDYVENLYLFE